MREIKFRGKHIASESWVYGNLLIGVGFDGEQVVQIEKTDANDFCQWEVYPESVGQFTGLHDKDGKEVYEGDILKANLRHKDFEIIGRVSMPKSCWVVTFLNPKNGYYNNRRTAEFDVLEVIGNVFDNPELMNNESTNPL